MNEESSTGGDLEAETCWAFTVFDDDNRQITSFRTVSDGCQEVKLVEAIQSSRYTGVSITPDMYRTIADLGFAFSIDSGRGIAESTYTLLEVGVCCADILSDPLDAILASYKDVAGALRGGIRYLHKLDTVYHKDPRPYTACIWELTMRDLYRSSVGLLFDELTPSEARHILERINSNRYSTDIPEDAMHVLYKKSGNIVMADITSRIDDTI